MRRLLADRDARLYLSGQTLSAIGDSSLWLAMGIWVKILTGSSSAAGLVFFAFSCGLLLAPPAASSPTGCRAGRCWRPSTWPARPWCACCCWCTAAARSG